MLRISALALRVGKNQMCCLLPFYLFYFCVRDSLRLIVRWAFLYVAQRAAYWRWAGFLALNFNRRTEVEFCTSVDTKPFSPPIANTMLYDVVMFWVLVQLNIFVCHFLIYPGICTLIFLTIQFLFLKLNQSLKIEQSNFPLYRSLKMFVLF